jgi:hypothetical protein
MKTITIEVPDDVFSALRRSPEEFARDMRHAAAIHSQGKAAEIAGLDRTEFLYSLALSKVDAFQIGSEELKEKVACDLPARRERLAAHLPDAGGTP